MVATIPQPFELSAQSLLPDLLSSHPGVRPVLDRYGLRGCGGRLGPVESIAFFARAHGVDEASLLSELRAAIALPPPATTADHTMRLADTIYRRFFIGAIITVLTAGAAWGAWILLQIGYYGKFTGVGLQDINAHGQAQIYGWMGLFIMGFGYQAFPRLWHTDLVAPRLAAFSFIAMLAGILLRTVGMVSSPVAAYAVPTALAGGLLQRAAIATFVLQILITFRRARVRLEPYIGFILSALCFFIASAALDTWYTWHTMAAASRDDLLWYVATYQAPLRDLQVHGLALLIILGVCLRQLPGFYNVAPAPTRRAWSALAILVTAVIAECAIFIAYRWSGNHILAAFLMIPWLMLAVGSAMIFLPWRLWRPFDHADRSAKFIRTAYAWLTLSLVMLLLFPVYQAASHIPFSHAYYGAIRHAITVGFVSLMIMGFAAKVVPTLNGIDPKTLSAPRGPYLLINLGCFLRVSLQTLTDWHPAAFHFVGISGLLEVTALAWWGIGLIRIMRAGKHQESQYTPSAERPAQIAGDHIVADVLAWFPATEAVFYSHGFTPLRSAILRRTVARAITIAQAAPLRGVPLEPLLQALNAVVVKSARSGLSLRVLSDSANTRCQ